MSLDSCEMYSDKYPSPIDSCGAGVEYRGKLPGIPMLWRLTVRSGEDM